MTPRRRHIHPLDELSIALGSAATHIANATFRSAAVREAHAIRHSNPERFDKGIGKVARTGRALLKRLDQLDADELDDAAKTLRFCAQAIRERHNTEITETWLGQRKRRGDRAHV